MCLGKALAQDELFTMAAKLVKNFEFGKPVNPNDIPDLDTYRRAFMIGPARYKTRIICKN